MTVSGSKVTKDIIESASHNLIVNNRQAVEALNFAFDVLQAVVDETKVNEPYATVSIREMEKGMQHIWDAREIFEDE
jgi:hypothetical protein